MERGTVFLTGGGRGIGRAIAEALVAGGRRVAVTWVADEAAAAELVAAHPDLVSAWRLDLRDRAAADSVVRRIEAEWGEIDGLVNNAGVRRDALLAMTSDDDWDHVLDTNLGGAFRCCRAVLPRMVSRRRGTIVNVASLSALHGLAGQAAYAASKAGLIGLTRSLAREVGRRGIRVNAVVPGFVDTGMTEGIPAERLRALRAGECLPGGVSPAAVAGAVCFLLDDTAASITGQTIVVDAGSSA